MMLLRFSVADLKLLKFCGWLLWELQSKSHIRIVRLLAPQGFQSSHQTVQLTPANFGIATLALIEIGRFANAENRALRIAQNRETA